MPPTVAISQFPSPEPIALSERMERLRQEARELALEGTNALLRSLQTAAAIADQVADGGEAYQVGVRENARCTQTALVGLVLNLRSIMERTRMGPSFSADGSAPLGEG
jgi:hypothetical protein